MNLFIFRTGRAAREQVFALPFLFAIAAFTPINAAFFGICYVVSICQEENERTMKEP